jgi:hypothetical protein
MIAFHKENLYMDLNVLEAYSRQALLMGSWWSWVLRSISLATGMMDDQPCRWHIVRFQNPATVVVSNSCRSIHHCQLYIFCHHSIPRRHFSSRRPSRNAKPSVSGDRTHFSTGKPRTHRLSIPLSESGTLILLAISANRSR